MAAEKLTDDTRVRLEQMLNEMRRPLWVWSNARALLIGAQSLGEDPAKSRCLPVRGAMKRRDKALLEIIDMMSTYFSEAIDASLEGDDDES